MGLDQGFQLGPWQVRPTLGTIDGPARTVHLEPKVMAVLVCLAERADEVVTREQLIEHVWLGRVVSDEVLSRCISLLRTALGDHPREPRFVQTVPKIGYRLVERIEPLATAVRHGGTAVSAAPRTPWLGRTRWQAGALLSVGALAAGIYVYTTQFDNRPMPDRAAQATIAVLPFANLDDAAGSDYFSDGLTEELIDRLAHVAGLEVAARTSAFSFKGSNEDVRTIGKRLGVAYVLEGSVRREGDQVRITAQLIDATRGFHIWSKRFDGELRHIFALQDQMANAIVVELQPHFRRQRAPVTISTAPPTEVIRAYELVLLGRYQLKRRDETSIRRSIELFEEAIRQDPGFGEAYRELAMAYAVLPYYAYEDIDEMFDLALQTIQRGTEHDPGLDAAAQDILAFIHQGRWQWIEAEEAFRRALAVSPNDPNLHQWYSQLRASVGDAPGSLEHALRARRLDVLSPVVNDRLAIAYMWVSENGRAQQQFDVARELRVGPAANPEAHLVLLLRLGDYEQAGTMLVGLQKLFARASEWIDPFLAALQDPAMRPAARLAVSRAAEQRSISLKYLYGAWIYLGESDAAMEIAFQLLHEPAEFDVEFLFATETETLRRHPRFGELVTAIGLDRYWERYGWPPMCARRGERIECH